MVPQPLDAVASDGDLMRRAEMIGSYVGGLAAREHRDRQIAQPHGFVEDAAAAVVAAGQMTRSVVDEVVGGHQGLGPSLAEAVDQVRGGVGPRIGFRAPVPRVVGVAGVAEGRGMAERVAVRVVGESFRIGIAARAFLLK